MVQSWEMLVRIVTSPTPFSYCHVLSTLTFIFVYAFPYAFVEVMGALVVPSSLIICLGLFGVVELAQELENPLGWDVNDIDLNTLQDMLAQDLHGIYSFKYNESLQVRADGGMTAGWWVYLCIKSSVFGGAPPTALHTRSLTVLLVYLRALFRLLPGQTDCVSLRECICLLGAVGAEDAEAEGRWRWCQPRGHGRRELCGNSRRSRCSKESGRGCPEERIGRGRRDGSGGSGEGGGGGGVDHLPYPVRRGFCLGNAGCKGLQLDGTVEGSCSWCVWVLGWQTTRALVGACVWREGVGFDR